MPIVDSYSSTMTTNQQTAHGVTANDIDSSSLPRQENNSDHLITSGYNRNDSTRSSSPTSAGRLSDYFDKMTEMQRKAFEKLYESASNGLPCHALSAPCDSLRTPDGPCQALVACEQNLKDNFNEVVRV